MAEKDGERPSLELPSLGFGRKRGKESSSVGDEGPVAAGPAPLAPELATDPLPSPAAPPPFLDGPQDATAHADAARVTGEPAEPKPERDFRLPAIRPMAAALVTGAVVGALLVGLTDLGFRFCELVQGAPSCGDPGFLLLLAIVIVIILVGKALLAAWGLPDPGSTSFLAVGLLSVVALLFLVDVLFDGWMILVIPTLSMLCFALSHWVSTAFVDDVD